MAQSSGNKVVVATQEAPAAIGPYSQVACAARRPPCTWWRPLAAARLVRARGGVATGHAALARRNGRAFARQSTHPGWASRWLTPLQHTQTHTHNARARTAPWHTLNRRRRSQRALYCTSRGASGSSRTHRPPSSPRVMSRVTSRDLVTRNSLGRRAIGRGLSFFLSVSFA